MNTQAAALKRSWALDLSNSTLYDLLKLRVEVFVVEQACAYPELDGRDLLTETRHFWLERDGEVVCTLRLLEEHDDGEKAFRIGRLCTQRSARGQGHTTRILREVRNSRCDTSQMGNRTAGTSSSTRTMPGVLLAISVIMAPMPMPWRTSAQCATVWSE